MPPRFMYFLAVISCPIYVPFNDNNLFFWKATLALIVNSISFVLSGVPPIANSIPEFLIEPKLAKRVGYANGGTLTS